MERPPTLLLVEDEQLLRSLVSQFLRQSGYRVVEARDGQEAIELFHERGPFGLVLLDLNLPCLPGVEVCRRIKLAQPGQAVLIVSAAIVPESDEALRSMGVEDRLTKPYHPETLLDRIRRLTGEAPDGSPGGAPSARKGTAGLGRGLRVG